MRLGPISSTYSTNPAATWRRILRFHGHQVRYDPELELWLIAGHDNVRTALTDAQHFSSATTLTLIRPLSAEAAAVLARYHAPNVLVSADGRQYDRIRGIMRAIFPNTSARVTQTWGPLVTRRTKRLVKEIAAPGVDLILQRQSAECVTAAFVVAEACLVLSCAAPS